MASPPDRARRVFRIVSRDYLPFDGEGARRWGSRWVSPGSVVVHASETYALAVLENLVHWQTSRPPRELMVVEALIPIEIGQSRLDRASMPGWERADYAASRAAGDRWYQAGEAAVLWVPSVVSAYEANVLVNQRHPDFGRIVVGDPVPVALDPRLGPR